MKKANEVINENLPNGKIDIGTSFGKYGFTITKQELEEKEDKVSAYVLQRHPNINSCNFLFFIHNSNSFLILHQKRGDKDIRFYVLHLYKFLSVVY